MFGASDRNYAPLLVSVDVIEPKEPGQSKPDGRSGCVTEESPSLTYAVDTTGSMYDDFTELKKVNTWLLERVALKFPCSFRQYTMVEFNDPDVGPVRITDKMAEFGSFFNNLEAIDGGDCPELSMTGVKLALQSSPHMSFIIVLTDASSKDYTNATLMNEVITLIDTTKSQVLFLTTGICVSEISPDYTIYRNVSSRSFGHVFRLTIPDLNKAFHYLDYTLSMALNSSKRLYSGDFTDLVHSKSFSVNDIFWTLMITTDGRINSFEFVGPAGSVLALEELVSEHWGSMHLFKNPIKGNYRININAGGVHAIRIQGFSGDGGSGDGGPGDGGSGDGVSGDGGPGDGGSGDGGPGDAGSGDGAQVMLDQVMVVQMMVVQVNVVQVMVVQVMVVQVMVVQVMVVHGPGDGGSGDGGPGDGGSGGGGGPGDGGSGDGGPGDGGSGDGGPGDGGSGDGGPGDGGSGDGGPGDGGSGDGGSGDGGSGDGGPGDGGSGDGGSGDGGSGVGGSGDGGSDCTDCHPNAKCEKYAEYEKCVCMDGYIGDGNDCTDIDECAYPWTHSCPEGICENTDGSYICRCPNGGIALNGTCKVISCDNPIPNNCHRFAKCTDNIHGYTCKCHDGYYGDGFHCEIDECQTGICGTGMDCTKLLGSYRCYNPCVSHTVLDEPWRSTDRKFSSTKNCDISKNGWYQFVGNGGVRIPETCIPEGSCSTDYPVWMNGTHPVITDGIVSRPACANWNGNCCRWTSTIQVKACPLGFHVYKLIKTPDSECALSYCTDSHTKTCKVDEEWQKRDKGYGCFCKPPHNINDLSQVVPDLICGLYDMRAAFHKCQFNDADIYFNESHVLNNSRLTFLDDPVTNTFSIIDILETYKYGLVAYEKNSTHVTYKTIITIEVEKPGAIIIRKNPIYITLLCVYPLDMMTSLNITLKPILSSINITVLGIGQFEVIMALYQDSGYTNPYTGSSLTLSTDKFLYVGVFVRGGTSNFVLVMKNCYATPTSDPNNSLKYYIIQNGCPNKQDGTITVEENGVSRQGRFSVQMFKFVGKDYNEVHLHCAVSLCDTNTGSCKPVSNFQLKKGLEEISRPV
ncbi:uromodulin-like [Rana temporaria]|uniref:uromodulin-like n=1 Tax=Rana temporaria TaxID=8407 RepID=UPI001AAC9D77|nr:uromodulin-like [Rana temporaria]